uniref:Uncharacterized protein n=1 Tax=viral metagenome TaxID=1070528 RepID=A0A6M3JQN7_9ZZZZ
MTLRKLILEDLTKTELVKLVREAYFYQPTQRELLKLRWESMSEEASCIMAEANRESQQWTGIKTFEALKKWSEAQELFDKGLALSDKADALFKVLCETKD